MMMNTLPSIDKCGQRSPTSTRTHILEPIGPTILALQPRLARVELTSLTAATFRTVGTVVEGDVIVADVLEPAGCELSIIHGQRNDPVAGGGEKQKQQKEGESGEEEEEEEEEEATPRTHQWILDASSNKPSAIECTGASPHLS